LNHCRLILGEGLPQPTRLPLLPTNSLVHNSRVHLLACAALCCLVGSSGTSGHSCTMTVAISSRHCPSTWCNVSDVNNKEYTLYSWVDVFIAILVSFSSLYTPSLSLGDESSALRRCFCVCVCVCVCVRVLRKVLLDETTLNPLFPLRLNLSKPLSPGAGLEHEPAK
jgi:hypothetical protein